MFYTISFRIYFNCLLCCFLWIGCSGSAYFANKGRNAEKAGRPGEASYYYLQSLKRNSNNLKALSGLQIAGQEHLNRLLDKYFQYHNEEKLRDAVYAFQDADNFHKDVTRVRVDLRFPEYYREYYQEDRDAYLDKTYTQAQDLFRRQQFKEAESLFSEVKKWNANYKDVGKMRAKAEIIPLYEEALQAYDLGYYKSAYNKFLRVTELDAQYEQAALYLDESVRRGVFIIAYTPIVDMTKNGSISHIMGAKVLSDLSKAQHTFFQVVDRSNLNQVLAEQKLALNSAGDYARVGEILGAKAILSAKILEYTYQGGTIATQRRTGYESFVDSVRNASTGRKEAVTRYKKVYYNEHNGQSVLKCKVQYQLVSTENGRTLVADLVEEQITDQVKYITYNGNIRSLVSGSWTSLTTNHANDKVYDSPAQRNEMRRLAEGKRTLRNETELRTDAVNKISGRLVKGVLDYETTIK